MSVPDWTPAVGDRVWVGNSGRQVPYDVVQVGVDAIGTPVVELCAASDWRTEITAVYLDGAWLAGGRWPMQPVPKDA